MLNRFYIAGFAGLFLLTTFLPTACVPDFFRGSSTTDVVGTVFLDGQPVEGAKVVFIPMKSIDDSGRVQNFSYATTDAEGEFALKRANGDPGAVTGRHRVIISKRMKPDNPVGSGFDGILQDLLSASGKSLLWQSPDELVPIIYNRQSSLTFDVDASLKQVEANFDLSSVDPLLFEK